MTVPNWSVNSKSYAPVVLRVADAKLTVVDAKGIDDVTVSVVGVNGELWSKTRARATVWPDTDKVAEEVNACPWIAVLGVIELIANDTDN